MRLPAVKHLFKDGPSAVPGDWRGQLRNQIRSIDELLLFRPELVRHVAVDSARRWEADRASRSFRFATTRYYAGLIDAGNPECPILAQVLPQHVELHDLKSSDPDPLREEQHMPIPGLTHRYPDRVLWYLSHHCAVYCRFCLRKRKVSRADSAPRRDAREQALNYIASHTRIKEVILSGGDPLSLADEVLDELLTALRNIEHLISIRIHTRMPVTLPDRITPTLVDIFQKHYPITLVTHFNHAAEITEAAAGAVRRLRMAGVLVLNQSVLLRAINDTVCAQQELLSGLVRMGVKPYYLHRCDPVSGVSHFQTAIRAGAQILQALRGRNPGIALPRYVIDLPGGGGKVPIEVDYARGAVPEGGARFSNWAGEEFIVEDTD